ncbi:helix-turn-helix domain-containing protein [Aeromicrobium sp. 9AM]|uniref:helix-turn-helix domain-containing protein n=1 Tax=Aeromicrobium sp. 9AM TaxID=2653126 RepID=UPI0012F06B8F|nr:XRE family transcriptional regulator [Aeromicrobium sp. 9AM]VXB62671.1 HTH-type transcriptional regulator SinR [Aeromicrobium sp. 9AM]
MAANIRRPRDARRVSLAELAARSGVAKSTLSQIEGATSNPTLSTPVSLAGALGARLEDLTVAAENRPALVVRAGEGTDISDPSVGARIVDTFPLAHSTAEFHHLTLRVDRSEVSASHGTGSLEHASMLSGSARVGPKDHEVVLHQGDYASYRADVPHTWEAVGEQDAEVWLLAVYPK